MELDYNYKMITRIKYEIKSTLTEQVPQSFEHRSPDSKSEVLTFTTRDPVVVNEVTFYGN